MKKLTTTILLVLVCSGEGLANKIAILGDSVSTGAGTHPALEFDTANLWHVLQGEIEVKALSEALPALGGGAPVLPAPKRLFPSPREFYGGLDWLGLHFMLSVGTRFLDTEQYSWGYQLGREIGYAAPDILIAAENGSQMRSLTRQLARVFAETDYELPKQTFIFFTGNDLCAPAPDYITEVETFANNLKRGLLYLLRNSAPQADGDVYVLGFMSILQLIQSESIQAKEVQAFGESLSCKELRERRFLPPPGKERDLPDGSWLFAAFLPPNPATLCPTLFYPEVYAKSQSVLANRIRAYRTAARDVVKEIAELAHSNTATSRIRFHYVDDTSEIEFTGEDIALDCFHLSVAGQSKISQVVLKAISERQTSQPTIREGP